MGHFTKIFQQEASWARCAILTAIINLSTVRVIAGQIVPGRVTLANRKLFWTVVGFVEVKSLFTFYPREHRSPVRSYGL